MLNSLQDKQVVITTSGVSGSTVPVPCGSARHNTRLRPWLKLKSIKRCYCELFINVAGKLDSNAVRYRVEPGTGQCNVSKLIISGKTWYVPGRVLLPHD